MKGPRVRTRMDPDRKGRSSRLITRCQNCQEQKKVKAIRGEKSEAFVRGK